LAWDRAIQPVADARDGLDGEGFGRLLRQSAHASDDPVDRVVAHHRAAPAARDEFVAGDDAARRLRQDHQHLHHPRLEALPLAVRFDFPERGPHSQVTKQEVGLARQIDGFAGRFRAWAGIHRQIIRKSSVPSPFARASPGACCPSRRRQIAGGPTKGDLS